MTNDSISSYIKNSLKKEFFLNIDNFGEVSTYDGLLSFARLVQRLIIMEPRSYPDDPDMGIGIGNYEFEFLDNITTSELSEKIKIQINKYIPNDCVDYIKVEAINDDRTGNKNTIGILVNFSNTINGKNNVVFTFDKVGKTGKIESRIYI